MKQKENEMRCSKCKTKYRKNFFNVHKFSMNLYQTEAYPHSNLDFEVVSFFDSTRGGICNSTFHLYFLYLNHHYL